MNAFARRAATVAGGLACAAFAFACLPAHADPDPMLAALAAKQKPAFMNTLRDLVGIESGSKDLEGLHAMSDLVAERLRAVGAEVELIDPSAEAYRMQDTPPKLGRIVRATLEGSGTKKILLIAHMDTVYTRGMLAQQPFRVDGERAWGLGVADDKQGIALIVHAITMLNAMGFREYGTLTVLIDGDEEISSPGGRVLLGRIAPGQDAVLSYEGPSVGNDHLSLATAGIGAVTLEVAGKASHAGSAPEDGVNALYELSHQVLQMRELSDPSSGLKLNWTMAQAGSNRNVIPADARAEADVRVLKVDDFDRIERQVREHAATQLIPDAKVKVGLERRRPPMEASDASRALAAHAQQIYRQLGRDLGVSDKAGGGGTDAAFAALAKKPAVVERFGLVGYGSHSGESEYVLLDSIEPRLYLSAQMIIDIARGKAGLPAP